MSTLSAEVDEVEFYQSLNFMVCLRLLENFKDIRLGWSESEKYQKICRAQNVRVSTKSLQTTNAGEDVEKRETLNTVGGTVNWYSNYGKQYGVSSKN